MKLPELTIGIEEEYQIIDPESRELQSYVQQLLERGRVELADQIKPEFLQSQIEVGTKICRDIAEARDEVHRLRRSVKEIANDNGLEMAAASTHPFSSWLDQRVTLGERYSQHLEKLAELARRMLIFGMHVHVGIEDRDLMVDIMDQARYFLPHLLALSTSSPLWHGRRTGLKSYRSIVFQSLPRTGPPPTFTSWNEHQRFIETLIKTGCIDEPTKIWWDVRPHPRYSTLEFRVCDICTRPAEAVCVAAIIQAIVAKLIRLRLDNLSWRHYPQHLVNENKWRAIRYGVGGKLIDFGRQEEIETRVLIGELLEWLDDVVDDLGTREEISYAEKILAEGTSADRQIAVYDETGDLKAVVDHLIRETQEGVDEGSFSEAAESVPGDRSTPAS